MSGWSSITPSSYKKPKIRVTKLSDDELRSRIFANAKVLFPAPPSPPSTTPAPPHYPYEIVYATKPKTAMDKQLSSSDPPWQYALLVRRTGTPSEPGDYVPLLKGPAWSSPTPWSMILQGLLDSTSLAVHRKFASVPVSPPTTSAVNLPVLQSGEMARLTRGEDTSEDEQHRESPPAYERSGSNLLLQSGALNRMQRMQQQQQQQQQRA